MSLTLLKLKTGEYCLCVSDHCKFNKSLNTYYTCNDDLNRVLEHNSTNSGDGLDELIGVKFDDFHLVENPLGVYNYVFFYGMHRNELSFLIIPFSPNLSFNDILKGFQFSKSSVSCIGHVIYDYGHAFRRDIQGYRRFVNLKFTEAFTVTFTDHYIQRVVSNIPTEDHSRDMYFYKFFDKHNTLYYVQNKTFNNQLSSSLNISSRQNTVTHSEEHGNSLSDNSMQLEHNVASTSNVTQQMHCKVRNNNVDSSYVVDINNVESEYYVLPISVSEQSIQHYVIPKDRSDHSMYHVKINDSHQRECYVTRIGDSRVQEHYSVLSRRQRNGESSIVLKSHTSKSVAETLPRNNGNIPTLSLSSVTSESVTTQSSILSSL
ncbi:hypothetical protein ECHHL_0525 [Ehrlichia chaffeensis str. Heartland]|uniref:Uncharacterized protein n=1 Tax=Ehrlichia chaffeensis (strain ATCC CRL-10679 / Arkansas) TaxID=205920 RepID=Q2GGM1_EHRCR|nr:hypothetical protein [Ehrlichia chaffeensis]ABD45412.1 hypothetical protein ECH_0601 [Ehrlichia chaffeensis str. Arkansas]AHX03683.1 hypothetical protein ECHHL_0525 [Ehrlichia chaffeensis str. Heartland]AHX05596.1 hypothetical protein ECHJAX_0532 [Ehrlichia chaffeensis str. Jax]AHX06586.1 hypothetical protein ECHLIB_0533 [Ehrlichia chaffeensis str. Liberty]AHX07349.1 hypothetical protein ECHOSC_0533 [Ehrlichia chaffeensis str. Osceola]